MCQVKYVICPDINEQVNPGSKTWLLNVRSILKPYCEPCPSIFLLLRSLIERILKMVSKIWATVLSLIQLQLKATLYQLWCTCNTGKKILVCFAATTEVVENREVVQISYMRMQ